MFVLTKISDTIALKPSSFSRPTEDALEDEINTKYANKVLHNTGVCICLYDIESIGDGLIKPGDGAAYVKTVFRMIVFRPYVGEILVGYISSCTESGINVRMDFFSEIHIPKAMLFEDCGFISKEQAWVWTPDEDTKLYLDTNEKIRFRVEQEVFTEQIPERQGGEAGGAGSGSKGANMDESPKGKKQQPPYHIIGSCQLDGMGLVSWWE